jgi:hypothetical protein
MTHSQHIFLPNLFLIATVVYGWIYGSQDLGILGFNSLRTEGILRKIPKMKHLLPTCHNQNANVMVLFESLSQELQNEYQC